MTRLETLYRQEVAPRLIKELGLSNTMQAPRLTKISLNMGVSEALTDKEALEHAVKDMRVIAGQQPVITKAKKSIAGFKIRSGWPIGCKLTLRRAHMYEFLDRLINVAIPRIRDFRGISPKVIDKQGNASIGISEQLIFPEVDYDKTDTVRGMDITLVTNTTIEAHTKALLLAFQFPFRE